MSDSGPWTDQWLKAQQQFVDAWSQMAQAGSAPDHNPSELWARGFDLWRQASGAQAGPDVQQALDKCFAMGKEYLSMAEQVSRGSTRIVTSRSRQFSIVRVAMMPGIAQACAESIGTKALP